MNLENDVIDVCQIIIDRGIEKYEKKKKDLKLKNKRLYYEIGEREYLGAAHGYFGILYILLNAFEMNK